MIPASATAAPADPSAAPATTATAAPNGTPDFDSVLMLQGLAGTADLEEAGLEPADTTDLLRSDDEDRGEELEASLAFLSGLLAVTRAGHSSGDSGSGGGSQGDDSPATSGQNAARQAVLLAVADAGEPGESKEGDALLTAVKPEAVDGASDASQALNRAAEMLSTVSRAADVGDKSTLATHVRDPRWADELGARVSLMIRSRESSASLQLTPVDLGPVEVNVTVKDSQATIHFGATQADTRALLEAALPRLREMLAAQGFQLTDASVSSGFARDRQTSAALAVPGGSAMAEAETSTTEARPMRVLGLLDVYA